MSESKIKGYDHLKGKQSIVHSSGKLKIKPIVGVEFRPTRPVPHEDGVVTEVARTDWPIIVNPVVQVHITTTYSGRVRAWGLHERSVDRLFVVCGLVRIVVYDGRRDSPTFGCLNEFTISDKNPGLLTIPVNLYHGWKNIGINEAIIINMPDKLYNYDEPDALDLPYDSADALQIVPYRFL